MSQQPAVDGVELERQLLANRLLALLRQYECVCAEMTCERCIAHFIALGQFEEADFALVRWEQVTADQSPQSEISNPRSARA